MEQWYAHGGGSGEEHADLQAYWAWITRRASAVPR